LAKVKALKCKECGKEYPVEPIHVCEYCFGPLEIEYDYDEIKKIVSREKIEKGPKSLWRYDSVNHPTLSFKDRVVAVALSKAREFGFDTAACASTGNLANSVAANAAASGMNCYVFIPANLETNKIIGSLVFNPTVVAVEGNYDDVNRLSSEVANEFGWAFVNGKVSMSLKP